MGMTVMDRRLIVKAQCITIDLGFGIIINSPQGALCAHVCSIIHSVYIAVLATAPGVLEHADRGKISGALISTTCAYVLG